MAIAFDNSTNLGEVESTSLTTAHTCTGDNLLLLVGVRLGGSTDDVTGVTYNSVAMTRLKYNINDSSPNNTPTYIYGLLSPDTGANNVVVTRGSSGFILAVASSYTGVKQSGLPDSTAENETGTATSIAVTTTTVADNCWTAMQVTAAAGNLSAGANTTLRQMGSNTGIALFDSNTAITPAGSTTLNANFDSGISTAVMVSFEPFIQPSFIPKITIN